MADKMEEPAKNWQISVLEKRLDQNDKYFGRFEDKIDKILEKQITGAQFEDRITSLSNTLNDRITAQEDFTKSQIKEVHLKYGPVADNLKWATRGILLLGAAQLLAFVINLLGTAK